MLHKSPHSLSFELFFAKKSLNGNKHAFSKPIIRISILAIALGVAMMTLSLSIVQGFQDEIQKKIIGFGSHIQISNYESKGLLENKAISKNRDFYHQLPKVDGIRHVQVFASKGAILKTEETNYGVVLKGIDENYDWTFFNQYIISGASLLIDSSKTTNNILISEQIAKKLDLDVGSSVVVYFLTQPPRIRKLEVSGIYNTGLGEMDERMAFIDLRHIQKINGWDSTQVGGFEVLIDDLDELEAMDELVYEAIDYDLTATNIKDARPDIFKWLELQDVNVLIIVSLLILVCGINVISALLILILEKTETIGILKAIGAKDSSLRKIFIYNAIYLIVLGLFFGNLIGIGLSLAQQEFGLLKLPAEAYFIDQVPIKIDLFKLLLLNLGTLVICFLMLIIPSGIISKIAPAKAIRYE